MEKNNIHIEGRRFQNYYGNTYYSSTLSINGEVVCSINNEYGYGNCYENELIDKYLKKSEYISYENFRDDRHAFLWNNNYSSNVIDCLKRDMVSFGKE